MLLLLLSSLLLLLLCHYYYHYYSYYYYYHHHYYYYYYAREQQQDRTRGPDRAKPTRMQDLGTKDGCAAVSPRTRNLDFRGSSSSKFFISRGGIPRSMGKLPRNIESTILRLRTLGLRIRQGAPKKFRLRYFHNNDNNNNDNNHDNNYYYYGRFPKFHRVFLGRDPGTLKSDIVSKNIHN